MTDDTNQPATEADDETQPAPEAPTDAAAATETDADTDTDTQADTATETEADPANDEPERMRLAKWPKLQREMYRDLEDRHLETQRLLRATRAEIMTEVLKAEGFNERAIEATGFTPDTFVGADGLIDREVLTAAAKQAAIELGLATAPRRPQPNPLAGTAGSGSTVNSGQADWDAAFGLKR